MMIRELKGKFDRVIVDTPALSLGADAAVIAARCGAALVVARQDQSRHEPMKDLTRAVRMGQVELVGSVLNEF